MEVIAQTSDGYFIKATGKEIREIVKSVTGAELKEIHVGQKIPAIDYASTITKIKALKDNDDYGNLLYRFSELGNQLDKLKNAVENASNIDV